MNVRGQGIAWDRSQSGTIYGIIRATAKERLAGGSHRVTVFKLSNSARGDPRPSARCSTAIGAAEQRRPTSPKLLAYVGNGIRAFADTGHLVRHTSIRAVPSAARPDRLGVRSRGVSVVPAPAGCEEEAYSWRKGGIKSRKCSAAGDASGAKSKGAQRGPEAPLCRPRPPSPCPPPTRKEASSRASLCSSRPPGRRG